MTTAITSRQNATLRHLVRLGRDKKYRQTTGEMVCEGIKMLYEALDAGVAVKSVLLCADVRLDDLARAMLIRVEDQGAALYEAEAPLFSLATDTVTPQGIVFSCALPNCHTDNLPEQIDHALLLDGLQDPGNMGTILRTANAFALDAVILCEGCTDPTAPKVVRATMGAIFRQPIFHSTLDRAVSMMRARGLPLYAAALDQGSADVRTAKLSRAAVIVGNEGRGVSREAIAQCDQTIIIPMAGSAESLNAGVAAAILIWEMTRGG